MSSAFVPRTMQFAGLGLGTSQIANQAAIGKSLWSSPGFSQFPTMWPSMSPWNMSWMMNQPLFSLADLNQVLYGYLRRTDDPNRSIAISSLQNPVTVSNLAVWSPRTRVDNSGKVDTDPSDLPSGLVLRRGEISGFSQNGICTKTALTKGIRFGPYRGKIVQTSEIKSNDDCSAMWEVFDDGKLSHYVDGKNHNGVSGWMSLVQCARHSAEQNLEVIQQDGEIYYQTLRDIDPGSELLVWYGENYESYMGIPVALKTDRHAELPPKEIQDGPDERGFSCERCGKMFTYKYYLEKHLKFTRCVDMGNRGFPCPICDRSFEKRDRLRIHILHVHEKYKPHVCAACGKSFSQSSSLNKHIRVHTGQRPYKCVHCAKTFTASSILRTHIRQHSGEKPFKCRHCGKSFASHAAHDSHVRRTHGPSRSDYQVEEEQVGEETGVLLVDV